MTSPEPFRRESSPINPEPLTQAELWLNNVANNPATLVTLLVLSRARKPLSRRQLYEEIVSRCGGSIPYVQSNFSERYRVDLERAGAVQKEDAVATMRHGYQKRVLGFEATPLGNQEGVALAGLLLDWQLRNPELPLQRLLGGSMSRVEGVQSPILRMLLLADLV